MSLPLTETLSSSDRFSLHPRFYELFHVNKLYEITNFTEQESPERAKRAWQIQGESYVEAGFLRETALDRDGCMAPELDRSRGPNVIYYHAAPIQEVEGKANEGGLRIVDIPLGGSIEDLASFRHSKASLYLGGESILREEALRRPVREVAALSHTNDADRRVSVELIRHIVQQAIKAQTGEMWLITFAPRAHGAMSTAFSPATVRRVGEDISIDDGDSRTSETLRLTPVVIEPCKVPDQMLAYLNDSDTGIKEWQKQRVRGTLLFLLDGLDDEDISEAVRAFKYEAAAETVSYDQS